MMAVQLRAPTLPLLMEPEPPSDCQINAYGFVHGDDGQWQLSPVGREYAAIAQRVLLLYVLQIRNRQEIAREFCMREETVQMIVGGRTAERLTAPLRRMLLAHGIGDEQMRRSSDRPLQIKAALERLAVQAANIIDRPQHFTAEHRQQVATDLYLLSGAWREDTTA